MENNKMTKKILIKLERETKSNYIFSLPKSLQDFITKNKYKKCYIIFMEGRLKHE
jgi:hypothetical protein